MAQINNLFQQSEDIAENTAALREIISAGHTTYLALLKKREALLDKPMAEVVSPVTGHKFGESFTLDTSTKGYPQVTLFPWLKGKSNFVEHPGSATRAFVSAFGMLSYATLKWHEHIALFDPAMARSIGPVRSTTMDGKRWIFMESTNGAFKFAGLNPTHVAMKTAKHREIDLMLWSLEQKAPISIVLFRDEYVAEWQKKVTDRLELTVKQVGELIAKDREEFTIGTTFGQTPKSATSNGTKKSAMVGDVDLETLTQAISVKVVSPISGSRVVLFDPSDANDFQRQVERVRNAAPGYTYEVVSN